MLVKVSHNGVGQDQLQAKVGVESVVAIFGIDVIVEGVGCVGAFEAVGPSDVIVGGESNPSQALFPFSSRSLSNQATFVMFQIRIQ